MKKLAIPLALSSLLIASVSAHAADKDSDRESDSRSHRIRTLAIFGDAPYGTTPTDTAQFAAMPAFIDAINADRDVSMAIHVGDIHSGSQYCTEAYDRSVYALWTRFQVPLIYTPGDNEWADCHKAKEGGGTYNAASGNIDYVRDANGNPVNYMGGDPVANLDLVRSIFFTNPGHSLGAHKLVKSQFHAHDRAHPSDAKYVENVMWQQSDILFATLNIPGGSNNDTDPWYGAPAVSDRQAQESSERTAADLRWLDAAFVRARSEEAQAIVLVAQADMWDLDGKAPSHIAQYKPFVDRIAALAQAFGKPVLLLNGDSHVYRSDNPLMPGMPCVTEDAAGTGQAACANDAYANQPNGYKVPNFHRITVHGSTAPVEWLKLSIDPRARAANGANGFGPFSWQRMSPR